MGQVRKVPKANVDAYMLCRTVGGRVRDSKRPTDVGVNGSFESVYANNYTHNNQTPVSYSSKHCDARSHIRKRVTKPTSPGAPP